MQRFPHVANTLQRKIVLTYFYTNVYPIHNTYGRYFIILSIINTSFGPLATPSRGNAKEIYLASRAINMNNKYKIIHCGNSPSCILLNRGIVDKVEATLAMTPHPNDNIFVRTVLHFSPLVEIRNFYF